MTDPPKRNVLDVSKIAQPALAKMAESHADVVRELTET